MDADYDPRIVELYDVDNPDGPDHEYYRALASEHGARRILDLGCGTGILTVTFAQPGRTVLGVDPSPAMLDFARRREHAETVSWLLGDAGAIAQGSFDFMVMTGNVAQHILDPHWHQALKKLRAVAADGAVLAFESRNPQARAWEGWAHAAAETRPTPHGPLTEWCDAEEGPAGQVRVVFSNRFEHAEGVLKEELVLAFRSAQKIRDDLAAAGFEVRAVWGDWQKTEFDGTQPLMVFEARAA